MADNLVFEESVQSVVDTHDFISKKWVYVNDNNNGNYSSQVVIDSTPLSNAGGYINWNEGYILMPLVAQLTDDDGAKIAAGSVSPLHTWAFKNGFWHMINSMTIEFNNQNVVQQTPFTNVFRSFKAMTSFSQDDVKNHGASIGFCPDNAGSWVYDNDDPATAGNVPNGRGLSNNRNAPLLRSVSTLTGTQINGGAGTFGASANLLTSFVASPASGFITANTGVASGTSNPTSNPFSNYSFNEGLLCRQEWVGYAPASTTQGGINNAGTCDATYRSNVKVAAGCATWYIYAKLRLKDLHDYFDKLPLLKGSTIRFYLNTNQTIATFSVAAPATTDTTTGQKFAGNLLIPNAPSINGGLTCPFTIASNDVGQGCSSLPAGTYQLSLSIYQNQFTQPQAVAGDGKTKLSSVRLYAPIYKFTPLKEQQYLSLAPTKKVKYCDVFQYQFNDIGGGSPFNFLVSNGISNIKSVLVVPFVAKSANLAIGAVAGSSPLSTLLSPITTSGATPDPITLTNFNILVSGVNLFLNNEMYDFEAFCHELQQSNQLNGGLTTGLTSGLISQEDFARGMRYYYGDCSRILPAEAGVSRSIQIVGTNASDVACDLMVFVEFEREMVIDLTTGARIA
jgi:hypothetical protein